MPYFQYFVSCRRGQLAWRFSLLNVIILKFIISGKMYFSRILDSVILKSTLVKRAFSKLDRMLDKKKKGQNFSFLFLFSSPSPRRHPSSYKSAFQ